MTIIQPATNNSPILSQSLNALLADLFALYFKTKNYHWHISGASFRDYHLLLDEQAGQIFGTTDAVAERVRKNGGTTLRSVGDVMRHQRIADDDLTGRSPLDMLTELRADHQALIGYLRALKAQADQAGDNATSGMTDDWVDEAQQRLWFLAEITGNNDVKPFAI